MSDPLWSLLLGVLLIAMVLTGSVFYVLFAIRHGVNGPLAQKLVTLTLVCVAVSILAHGASMRPLMRWYTRPLGDDAGA